MAEHSTHCPFCRIAADEDPAARIVCGDENWVAFFPPEPATPGHTLVIPRQHVADVWELGEELGGVLMRAVVDVGLAIRHALQPEGMNLISSSGAAAEQTVFHIHLHVVPRWADDEFGAIWPTKRAIPAETADDLADRVRRACAEVRR